MPFLPTLAISSVGVMLSMATAVLWAVSPLCWASAGRQIGSFPVLLLRSVLASAALLAGLPVYLLLAGPGLPSVGQLGWLAGSGLLGMVIGDALYYEALVILGPRRATQLMPLAPVASVLVGWVWLGESLCVRTLGGIALVLGATFYAVLHRPANPADQPRDPGRVSLPGVICGVGGSLCVGLGAVLGRQAFQAGSLDVIVATVARVCFATVMLWAVPAIQGQGAQILAHLRSGFVLSRVGPGTLAGPLLGMLCYVGALKQLQAGLVSTLTAMSPLFILPLVAIRYRTRIGLDIVIATALAILGVGLICR